MITVMKTKTFLNALDDAYAKGVAAGQYAEAVKDREDQNRRLEDMLQHGKALGLDEGFKKGYFAGYNDGEADARSVIGEIDIKDISDFDPGE